MKLHNEPNVKQDHRLLKIVIVSTLIASLLVIIFFLAGNFLPSTETKAADKPVKHKISGSIKSKENKKIMDGINNGDTIYLNSDVTVDEDSEELKGKDVIILVDNANLNWKGKKKLYLGKGSKLFLINGGELTADKNSDKNSIIYLGKEKFVSYTGESAVYSFAEVNNVGGFQSSGLEPLPVKLISFESILNNGKVNLKWSTATEINNDRFEIERSYDGKTWKVIGTVKGNGNSSITIDYVFTDNTMEVLSGNIYYRLHQFDFNGENEYSPISLVSNSKKENIGKVYPNPANAELKISLNTDGYQLTILDQTGKMVISKQVDSDFEIIDVKDLPNGIYFVKLENETISENHKIVVKH